MNLFWFRRDLRLQDNHALSAATLDGETQVFYIFDRKYNKRQESFINDSLIELEAELNKHGSSLIVLHGEPKKLIPKLAKELNANALFYNRGYEPIEKLDDFKNISTHTFKDSVFFEKEEIPALKVFGAYKKRWLNAFELIPEYKPKLKNLHQVKTKNQISNPLPKTFFKAGRKEALKKLHSFEKKMPDYSTARNFPAIEGTSHLSVYLRFGNISIREVLKATTDSTFRSELIWRDFYHTLLDAYPHVESGSFKPQYDQIKYLGEEKHFKLWCEGKTGFPIIDAAMRCLNETGTMHNRLRMVVASFLCKTLLIDWRKGEAYFKEKLLDYDLAANNGGWQWCSSSGADSQPYFRIFNPYNQSEKFDPENKFIDEWVQDSLEPIVNYSMNRLRCLTMYSVVKASK